MRLQHRRAAKLAGLPSDASANHSETYDVHDFPSALPSPPSSTRQTPFAVPKVGDSALQDDQNARNDPSGEGVAPTVSGRTLDERTLLDILCFHCDDGLTEDAFDAIMQHAAATAKPGDEFGILFVKRFISDLADTPINQDWLAEIIHRLQQSLDHLCDRAKSQIQSMGKLRLPECVRLEPPVESDAELPDDDEALKGFAKKIGTMSMGETTNDREDVRYQDSTVVSVRSKHSERKVKGTQRGSQPACKQSSTTQEFTVSDDTDEKHEPNNDSSDLQQPGAPKDSVYDLFVRSATEANCFATGHDRKAVKRFNKRVRRAWARMEPESRAAWVKFFQCSARRCAFCHQRQ